MGREARANAERKRARANYFKSLPIRIVKGITGVFFFVYAMPIMLGYICAEENKWPWDVLEVNKK